MTDALRDEVHRALLHVAPDADLQTLDDDVDVREELDIDSMDYLSFVIALSKRFGIEVPAADVGQLATVRGAIGYLGENRA